MLSKGTRIWKFVASAPNRSGGTVGDLARNGNPFDASGNAVIFGGNGGGGGLNPCFVCGGESTEMYSGVDYCRPHVPNVEDGDNDGDDISDMDDGDDDDNDNGDDLEQLSDPPDNDPATRDREMERQLRDLKRQADEGIDDRDQQRACDDGGAAPST